MRGRTTVPLLAAAVLLAGCTDARSDDPLATSTRTPSSAPAGSAAAEAKVENLVCGNSIGGDAPPADYTVVDGALALPVAPRAPALQSFPDNDGRLFAKAGLVVRAGVSSEIGVPDSVDTHVGIGWNNGPAVPSRRFLIPACTDDRGTGWLAYPGGFWADTTLCLPLDVRVGDAVQRVRVGVGTACGGQAAPPTA